MVKTSILLFHLHIPSALPRTESFYRWSSLICILWGNQFSLNWWRVKYSSEIKDSSFANHGLFQSKRSWSLLITSVSTMADYESIGATGVLISSVDDEDPWRQRRIREGSKQMESKLCPLSELGSGETVPATLLNWRRKHVHVQHVFPT